jgi:hypothetical protein
LLLTTFMSSALSIFPACSLSLTSQLKSRAIVNYLQFLEHLRSQGILNICTCYFLSKRPSSISFCSMSFLSSLTIQLR